MVCTNDAPGSSDHHNTWGNLINSATACWWGGGMVWAYLLSPPLGYCDNMDMDVDMATVSNYYIEVLDPADPHITEFKVYGFSTLPPPLLMTRPLK